MSLFNFRIPFHGLNLVLTAALLLSPLVFSPPAGAQSAPRVALITRSVPVPGADKAYVEHLRERGWSVTAIDDDRIRDSGRNVIKGYDLVVISTTVYWQRIKWRLRSAPEPIIIAKPQLFRAFGLAGNGRGDVGYTKASKKVKIANPRNPLSAGLSGEVIVATKAKPMNYSRPRADAYVIATSRDVADEAVVFAYGAGDKLVDGGIASGPRVGFYMTLEHPGFANRDGWALFDAAAAWAAPNAPAPNNVTEQFNPIPVTNGILMGADVAKQNFASGYDATNVFENRVGRKLDIINRNHEFSAGLNSAFFYDRKHIEDGRTLLMSWRATDNPNSTNGSPDPRRASKIVAGQFDEEIEAMATAMRDLEAPVLMMFAWEMDQNVGQPQNIGTAAEFIAAWRYVHRIFKQRGATNVEWVWAPRARSFAKDRGQTFYPGSEYVDWVGGLSVPINTYEDPRTIYTAWYQWGASTGKPLLFWLGLREKPGDAGWKPTFIKQVRELITGEWSAVGAFVYYHNISPLGLNYTIYTSGASQNAIRSLACDPQLTMVNGC